MPKAAFRFVYVPMGFETIQLIDDGPRDYFKDLIGGREEYVGLEFDNYRRVPLTEIPERSQPFHLS